MINRNRWWLAAAIILCWLPVFAPAAYSAVWQWSTSAASNASADPQVNWREGQPPSSVNDSARAMMAALAKYRDDISGLLTTGGTSTAYTVTTNQTLCVAPSSTTTPIDGQLVSITVHATNGAAPTLQADGCTAYPIQSSAGAAVASNTLVLGSPYSMRFSVANSAWMLRGFYASSTNIPVGSMVLHTGTSSPNSNFVLAQGQCLSTATYAGYWALLGSPASGSCAGGNFRIIDMSGRVPAGLDNGAGRLTSSATGCGTAMTSVGASCANGSESHTLTTAELAAHSHGVTDNGHQHTSGPGSPYRVASSAINVSTAGATPVLVDGGIYLNLLSTSINTTGIGINNAGGGGAHAIVQPTVAVNYLLRVL